MTVTVTYPHSVNGVQLYITRLLSLPQFSPIFSLGKCTVPTVSVGEDCHCTVHSTNSQSLSLSVSDISVSSSCQSVRRLICLSASPAYPPSGSESQCSLVGIWHSVHMYTTKYRVLQARDQHSRHSRARQVQNKETTGNIYLSVIPVHCRRLTAMNEALVVSL